MKASFGGIMNLFIIVTFIIIISSFLLFNISYAKAFRVKNKIITTYEQYEGNCESSNSACYKIIKNYEDRLGYNLKEPMQSTSQDEKCVDELGYCYTTIIANNSDFYKKKGFKAYSYKIRTEINIRFPLVENILGIGTFKVSGETHTIYKKV